MRTRFRPNDDFMIIFTRRRKSDRTRTDDFFRFRQNMIARDFVSLGHAEDGRRVRGFPHVFSVGAGNDSSFVPFLATPSSFTQKKTYPLGRYTKSINLFLLGKITQQI